MEFKIFSICCYNKVIATHPKSHSICLLHSTQISLREAEVRPAPTTLSPNWHVTLQVFWMFHQIQVFLCSVTQWSEEESINQKIQSLPEFQQKGLGFRCPAGIPRTWRFWDIQSWLTFPWLWLESVLILDSRIPLRSWQYFLHLCVGLPLSSTDFHVGHFFFK